MADQLPMPFILDDDETQDIHAFLRSWFAIRDQEARLRQHKAHLREAYADRIALRAVITAAKVVEAQRHLQDHPREPLPRHAQGAYEALVDDFLTTQHAEQDALARDLASLARQERAVPERTGMPG